MAKGETLTERRMRRNRHRLRQQAHGRPRLSVFRSSQHIYAQIIDDGQGATLAAASTIDKDLKGKLKTGADTEAAKKVGKLITASAIRTSVKEDE